MITPKTTVFYEGELAKYVTVVDKPCELTYEEKDGQHYLNLKVTLQMIKDGFIGTDVQDIQLRGAAAHIGLVDEAGTEVMGSFLDYLGTDNANDLLVRKLLTGKKGDTVDVVFSLDDHWKEVSHDWFKNATQFIAGFSTDLMVDTSKDASDGTGSANSSDTGGAFGVENVLLPSQLKGKVEVISAEKSVGRNGYPCVTVSFKLLQKVNTSSMCNAGGQMWLIGVGQNENGVDVKELLPNYREWRSDDKGGSEFKQFLEGDPDETITLEFTGDKDSSNDVASDLKKVKKFKLKITN